MIYETVEALEKAIMNDMKNVMEKIREDALDELIKFVEIDFYSAYEPEIYKRTEALLRACFASDIVQNGKGYYFEVGMDDNAPNNYGAYMDMETNIQLSSHGYHGTTAIYEPYFYWKDFTDYVFNGELLKKFETILKSKGFEVTVK